MKFDFAMKIAGMKKSMENGTTKIWEGADLNMSVDMTVEEMVQSFRNNQVSIDKIISFIKQDLPNSITQCGSAFLDLEKKQRILDVECPSKNMRKLLAENEELRKENNRLFNERDQEHDQFMNEHVNKLASYEQCDNLKKEINEIQEKYDNLNKKYEYLKKRYVEENGEEEYTEPKSKIF